MQAVHGEDIQDTGPLLQAQGQAEGIGSRPGRQQHPAAADAGARQPREQARPQQETAGHAEVELQRQPQRQEQDPNDPHRVEPAAAGAGVPDPELDPGDPAALHLAAEDRVEQAGLPGEDVPAAHQDGGAVLPGAGVPGQDRRPKYPCILT